MNALPRETEDALVALLAVKKKLLSEAVLEKVRERQEEVGRPLLEVILAERKLSSAQCEALRAELDPDVIEGFRIESEAGRGGMGVVYRARQLSLDRVVALKVLARRLADDRAYVEKFLAEARSAAKLNHENVVSAIDAGESDGIYYFAMEFIDGDTVAELLEKDGALPWQRTFEISEKVARALEHAHEIGIVHRDVKPENVMISKNGGVKLCDLGLAKPAAIAGTGEKSDTAEGTPYYCSPEQALGRTDIDARSDIYSLGMTIYHMLKGEPCYDGENARAIMVKQVREPLPDLAGRLPDVPAPLRDLLGRMLEKDREERLPSLVAWREQLEAARAAMSARGRPQRASAASPLVLAGAAFGVVAAVGVGIAFLSGGPAEQPPPPPPPEVAEAPEPPPDRRLPVRVKRDPKPTDPAPVDPRPGPNGSGASGSAAARLLADAREWLVTHPDDPRGAAARLRQVEAAHPGTPEAEQALRAREALRDELRRAAMPLYKALGDSAATAIREGRYAEAVAQVEAFEGEWGADLPELADQLAKLRAVGDEAAQARLVELERGLASGEASVRESARTGLQALADRGTPAVAARAGEILGALERESAAAEARAAWQRERDLALDAQLRGDLPRARGILETARGRPELAPVKADMERALGIQGWIEQVWAEFEKNLAALKEDPRLALKLRTGEELKGRLETYDPRAWTCVFRPNGARDAVALDLHDLAVERLLALVLPPDQGKANAWYFVVRRHPVAAKAALDAAVAAGVPDDAFTREVVASLEGSVREESTIKLLDRLMGAGTPAAELLKGARELPPEVIKSVAYRDKFEALKAAWIKARVSQLAGDPANLFRGKLVKAKKGDEVTLSWKFKDPAELEDWRADAKVLGTARVDWRENGMKVTGKATLQASFLGGAVAIEVKGATSDNSRPNLNLVLGDQGGWTGVLCGLGYQFGNPRRIDVDPSAPKKPGYSVPLPANVLVVFSGQAPPAGITCWAAEDQPSVLGSAGKALKFSAERDPQGEVKLKVKGRTVYSYGPVAGWDQPGSVAIAPLEAEMLVSEVEVTGRLDPTWVETRGLEIATREVAALPAPTAPPPPGTPPAPPPASGGGGK